MKFPAFLFCTLLSDSSERQLSLDLVNVGRQRLDFLPMLEHSGTYRETPMHSGTFVQEIITLVHQVREQYFRNGGVPLNERFSALPKAGHSEEATEELTLDERFSSSRCGLSQQPVRSSGDLRHDLDRRRQERLEGVKVTIPGNNMALRPLESNNIWYRNLCLQLQRSVLDQVCTYCSRDFGPLLHTGLLQIFQVLGLLLGSIEFQHPPQIFYWVLVWRLARPLQDLEILLMEPLLSCPGCVFGVIIMLGVRVGELSAPMVLGQSRPIAA
uniref:Uncharacterized protein n=2 Tax=Mastacembelus armatus TaxID=205130 RepID=A0A7N8YPS9_9TELE